MDWKFAKRTRSCNGCAKHFEPESRFFSALYILESKFERKDFCQLCWDTVPKENVFSFWKTISPRLDEVKKHDTKAVINFLEKCCSEKDLPENSIKLAYVSALFLQRKKEIKIQGTKEIDNKIFLIIVPRKIPVEWLLPMPSIDENEVQRLDEEFINLFTN